MTVIYNWTRLYKAFGTSNMAKLSCGKNIIVRILWVIRSGFHEEILLWKWSHGFHPELTPLHYPQICCHVYWEVKLDHIKIIIYNYMFVIYDCLFHCVKVLHLKKLIFNIKMVVCFRSIVNEEKSV